MSYVATDIATVPAGSFRWFVVFLEGAIGDDIKSEIDRYFLGLGREAGKDVLVVRGYDPLTFRESVYEAPAFNDPKWKERAEFPALLVTDVPPAQMLSRQDGLDHGKVLLFPLSGIYREQKTLAGFLSDLLKALRTSEAAEALERLEAKHDRKKYWGWLSRYLKMEPGFFGFKVDGNRVLEDILDC